MKTMNSTRFSTDLATAYARDVVAGTVLAGRLHRLACERHLRDVAAAPASGFRFDWSRAAKVCRFLEVLKHFKGAGFANKRIVLEPFQIFIVGALFGWVRVSDGFRRYRNAFVQLNRGNGKSTLCGGLGLWMAFGDGEPAADVYPFANKKDQARIVFESSRQMVLRSPALKRRGIVAQKHAIFSRATESKIEPLGSDVDTLDGLRPACGIADEVHKHASPELIEVIESGMGTRDQPLMIEITTAGENDTPSVYGQHFALSVNVLEGDVELPEWFAFIACADPDDDWTSESIWRKANPNYGVSIKPDFLDKECRKAKANPQEEPKFRRLYLGQQVEADERYITKGAWDRGALQIDPARLRGALCVLGLDLSSKVDITALVALWRLADGSYYCRPWFWIPEARLAERKRRDRVPYDVWIAQGFLETTPGAVVDQTYIRKRIVETAAAWKVNEIAFDPWNTSQLAVQLGDEDGLTCIEVRQGSRTLSEPTKALLELVLSERLQHDGNPLMNWMIANLRVKRDANDNVVPDKQKSRMRIDGPAALVTALSRAIVAPAPKQQRRRGQARIWTPSGWLILGGATEQQPGGNKELN